MRMTINMDDMLLQEAMRLTWAKSVREVVELALRTLVRLKLQERLRPSRGG